MNFSSKAVMAGTEKKGDVLITFEIISQSSDNEITVQSKVSKKYGEHIAELIETVLKSYKISGAKLEAQDFGAFDFAWKARIITAIERWNRKEVAE